MLLYVLVQSNYGYAGFMLNDSSIFIVLRAFVSLVFMFTTLYIFLKNSEEPVLILFYMLYLFYFLPLLAYYSLSDMSTYCFVCTTGSFVAILYSITITKNIKLNMNLDIGKNVKFNIWYLITIFLILEIAVILHSFWVSKSYVISFREVYVYRGLYGDMINQGIWGYVNSTVFKVVSPFLGILMLISRKYMFYLFILVLDLLLFASSGHKAVLFYFFLEMFVFIFLSKDIYISSLVNLKKLLRLFSIVLLCGIVLSLLNVSPIILSLLRRAFFVPVKLYNDYFEYILSGYGHLTYQTTSPSFGGVSIPEEIGKYNGSLSNANTGYIASAYILGGFLWVALYSFVVFCIVSLINSSMKKNSVDTSVIFVIFLVPTQTLLISSSLTTTMLTHGMFISILLAWVYSMFVKDCFKK